MAFQNKADSVRQDTVAHGQAVAAAPSLAAVGSLESGYLADVNGQFAAMNADMADMTSACGSAAMGDLAGVFGDMQTECSEHAATMGSAGTMGETQSEETHHQQTMQAMLDSMGTMQQTMMPTMGSCSGGIMGSHGM